MVSPTSSSHPSRGAWIEIMSVWTRRSGIRSHPSRGAWIEIKAARSRRTRARRRTPHGVRGLKYKRPGRPVCAGVSHPSRGVWIEMDWWQLQPGVNRSHPSRGAWIEIRSPSSTWEPTRRRTPHGVRGLKSVKIHPALGMAQSRTPHGVRGLKFPTVALVALGDTSHPSRGAWIEIRPSSRTPSTSRGRTPHGVRGLKLKKPPPIWMACVVAPLTGCVD